MTGHNAPLFLDNTCTCKFFILWPHYLLVHYFLTLFPSFTGFHVWGEFALATTRFARVSIVSCKLSLLIESMFGDLSFVVEFVESFLYFHSHLAHPDIKAKSKINIQIQPKTYTGTDWIRYKEIIEALPLRLLLVAFITTIMYFEHR